MILWSCPSALHPAVRGLKRPRRNDLCRYCLPCSEVAGRLVERTASVLEKRRAVGRQRQAKKARKRRAAKTVTQTDLVTHFSCGVDALKRTPIWFQGMKSKALVEVVSAKRPRATRITRTSITLYDVGQDEYEARAMAYVAALRWRFAMTGVEGEALRVAIRDVCERGLRVRPRLDNLKDAEREVAALLRAEAAVAIMVETRDLTRRRTA